ncbi:hypothetical protein [Kordiimonas sp.]|uniref:hypothetical protein n=1 Tax=Kordiimonas sp. TaxID=1970157 RepID=UPI003A9471EA
MINNERIGWILSATLHIGVAVVALVGLPDFSKDREPPPPPISIDFVKISEKNQVVAPEPEAEEIKEEPVEQEPEPEYAPEEVVEAAPAEAVPMPEAKPEVKPTPPKPTPKPEVTERMDLRSNVTPNAKPKPPSRLKVDRLKALIDRSIKEDNKPTPVPEAKTEEKKAAPKKEEPKTDMFAGIRGRVATATLMQALQQKVYSCWNIPAGAKGVKDMQVNVSVWLSSDGTMIGRPEFVNAGDLNDPDRAFFRVFAESALRAVQLCAPFPEASDYVRETGQNQIIFNFNPKAFLGG